MSFGARLLFGLLASGVPDVPGNDSETMEVPVKALGQNYSNWFIDYKGAAKFHIGMLTISLIVGLAYGGYVAYLCWVGKDALLSYIRNLVIALVCRTFFTILFDGVIFLESSASVAGGNTLLSFQQIFLNLVIGFWLSLTIYSHARVQRNFKSEPTLRLYQCGVPAVAVFFAFVWIFTLQDRIPLLWWVILDPIPHWIVNSANLLFLLIQVALVIDIARMLLANKSSLDNDSVSLLWKVSAMMGTLIFIFWLQFGLSLGPYKTSQSYLYFFYFIDGMEGTMVSLCLYFFNKWVALLNNKNFINSGAEETVAAVESTIQERLPEGRGIVTIDSVFMTRESEKTKNPEEEETKDIVYSNVVEPHRLQKTLELYKRFNVIPSQVTILDGDKFYDCQISEPETENQKPFQSLKVEENCLKTEKISEHVQKKNAFYASKYLILDPKEGGFPKYLETRPSFSSTFERSSEKEQQISRPVSLDGRELVRMWLDENSENMAINKPFEYGESKRDLQDSKLEKEIQKQSQKHHPITYDGESPTAPGTRYEETDESKHYSLIDDPLKSVEQTIPPVYADVSANGQTGIESNTEPYSRVTKKSEIDVAESNNKSKIEEFKLAENASNQSKEFTESETIPKQSSANVSLMNKGKPEEDKQKELQHQFLTYSELLEFRSKRDSSELFGPPASSNSLSDSIFSKIDSLINVGGGLLTSIAGFSQEKHEPPKTNIREQYRKGERQLQTHDLRFETNSDTVLQPGVKTSNHFPTGDKYSDIIIGETNPDLQEKATVSVAEDTIKDTGGTRNREKPVENDKFERTENRDFLLQTLFTPDVKRLVPTGNTYSDIREGETNPYLKEKITEPTKNTEKIIEGIRRENPSENNNFEKKTEKQFKEQTDPKEGGLPKYVEEPPSVSSMPETSKIDNYEKREEKQESVEQMFVTPDIKNAVPTDENHSAYRAQSLEFKIYPRNTQVPPENDSESGNSEPTICEISNRAHPTVEPQTERMGDLRKDHSSRNLITSDTERKMETLDASSESEFSIEGTQSLSYELLSDVESQMDSIDKAEAKRKMSSSSSSQSFSIENYCKTVMTASAKFKF